MIPDGASLMIGGFMAVGTPERIIDEIVRQNRHDLMVIANDTAMPGTGVGKLVEAKLLRKAIVSHIGLNPETQRQMMRGDLDVELVPQGTLIECIRAGGYGLGRVLQNREGMYIADHLDASGGPRRLLAVIAFPNGRATLLETGPGISASEVVAATEAELAIPQSVPEMSL